MISVRSSGGRDRRVVGFLRGKGEVDIVGKEDEVEVRLTEPWDVRMRWDS